MAGLLVSTPATAKPLDKGHFHDVFTGDVFDCDGTPAQNHVDVSGNFLFNQRGGTNLRVSRGLVDTGVMNAEVPFL